MCERGEQREKKGRRRERTLSIIKSSERSLYHAPCHAPKETRFSQPGQGLKHLQESKLHLKIPLHLTFLGRKVGFHLVEAEKITGNRISGVKYHGYKSLKLILNISSLDWFLLDVLSHAFWLCLS